MVLDSLDILVGEKSNSLCMFIDIIEKGKILKSFRFNDENQILSYIKIIRNLLPKYGNCPVNEYYNKYVD